MFTRILFILGVGLFAGFNVGSTAQFRQEIVGINTEADKVVNLVAIFEDDGHGEKLKEFAAAEAKKGDTQIPYAGEPIFRTSSHDLVLSPADASPETTIGGETTVKRGLFRKKVKVLVLQPPHLLVLKSDGKGGMKVVLEKATTASTGESAPSKIQAQADQKKKEEVSVSDVKERITACAKDKTCKYIHEHSVARNPILNELINSTDGY